jgi:hypothetical protein
MDTPQGTFYRVYFDITSRSTAANSTPSWSARAKLWVIAQLDFDKISGLSLSSLPSSDTYSNN